MNQQERVALQNRAEELLLELIYERILSTKPTQPNELGEPITERYEGYYEGWWDALEALRNTIDSHNEENGEKL